MGLLERLFERGLWHSRMVVIVAVIASVASAFALFYLGTVDVVYLLQHVAHYTDASLSDEARKLLRDQTVTHIVEVVDGYLLATVMLIFALGLYELFISDLDEARGSRSSSRILLIESLDDLKNRLAKVILMILVVKLFEHALKLRIEGALELLYLGGAIALVGLALYLSHASEGHAEEPPGTKGDAGR